MSGEGDGSRLVRIRTAEFRTRKGRSLNTEAGKEGGKQSKLIRICFRKNMNPRVKKGKQILLPSKIETTLKTQKIKRKL